MKFTNLLRAMAATMLLATSMFTAAPVLAAEGDAPAVQQQVPA